MKILLATGFDCDLALNGLNSDNVNEIEHYVEENRHLLLGTPYENVQTFAFRPGHRMLLTNIPKYLHDLTVKSAKKIQEVFPAYQNLSLIMKSLLETTESNNRKHPNTHRYNETIRYFSTYVYLMCGRACYDTLCANLPIPKSDTIG